MTLSPTRRTLIAGATAFAATPAIVHAQEAAEIRIAQQFGILYLPLIVLREQNLLREEVVRRGLPEPRISWVQLSGGAATNEALLSGGVDIVSAGIPPVVLIWARTRASNVKVRALAGLGGADYWLNTNNPAVKTIADFTSRDRIAVPAVKISFQSVVLQIAAEKAFGPGQHDRLEPLTVALPHPDATAALIGGRSEITAHFGNPPFQNQQIARPNIRRVLSSNDVIGPHTALLAYAASRWYDANPRTAEAFVAALDRASAWITANPAEAAALYLRSERSPLDPATVEAIIRDPGTQFGTTPSRVTVFSDFLARTGQVRERPDEWKDLFFPVLHARAGS